MISPDPSVRLASETVSFMPVTQVKVIKADFGRGKVPIVLHLEDQKGTVGAFPPAGIDVCFDSRFHFNYDYRGTPETYQSYKDTFLPACQSGNWSPEQNFLCIDDPQKQFPEKVDNGYVKAVFEVVR